MLIIIKSIALPENLRLLKQKANYVLRFDSQKLAKNSFAYFPVKGTYSDGFTIIIEGSSLSEWEIYKKVIELLRQKNMNIFIDKY